MTQKKCIYCGKTEDLSESDIIPDALTNARILNKNVCRIEHNNKFSDMFESEVISGLAFLTNELDIKSSKSSHYHRYSAIVKIDGVNYNARLTTEAELFHGKKIKSVDGNKLLGPIDDIKKIAHDDSEVDTIDVNHLEIEKMVKLEMSIYFRPAIFQMVAKIAYEWYCLKNGINDRYSEFDDIVRFITTGKGDNIVAIIEDANLYQRFSEYCCHGSHCLIAYVTDNKEVYVIFSLFGVVLYKVKLCNHIPKMCLMNCIYQELCIDGTLKEVCAKSLADLEENFENCFFQVKYGSITYMIPINVNDRLLPQKNFLINTHIYLLRNLTETMTANAQIVAILRDNLETLLQASLLHKKSLKRFVKEHFKSFSGNIMLNPSGSNKKDLFLFYIIYLVGINICDDINITKLYELVKKNLGTQNDNEYIVNDELCEKLKCIIFENDNYSDVLNKGAKLIDEW